MAIDFSTLRESLDSFYHSSHKYFESIKEKTSQPMTSSPYGQIESDANFYWKKLDEKEKEISYNLQSEFFKIVEKIANCLKLSTLATEADHRELSHCIKSIRASLRLRQYDFWDTEVLHDEGYVLGVKPEGQSESMAIEGYQAFQNFYSKITNIYNLLDLISVSPVVAFDAVGKNPQSTAEYQPNTAFVMMWINPDQHQLVDIYETIKRCFNAFGIQAIRADEIEHEEVITAKIIEKIQSSEFLVADLTGERPSVYYEIGYAHSLGRRVSMYRRSGTPIHFDVAAYNCPEYKNATELGNLLMTRIEHLTGRKPNSN